MRFILPLADSMHNHSYKIIKPQRAIKLPFNRWAITE